MSDDIREAANILTTLRQRAADGEKRTIELPIDTLRMLEQQMWNGYLQSRYAEALEEAKGNALS